MEILNDDVGVLVEILIDNEAHIDSVSLNLGVVHFLLTSDSFLQGNKL